MIIEEYKTTDIMLAAVLKLHNFSLDKIVIMGSKGVFYFKDVVQKVEEDFYNGKLAVEPISYHNNIKFLTTAVRRNMKE